LDIQQALSETTASLNGKSRDDLFNLSLTKDSDKLATMRILASMGSPTYQAAPPLFLLIVLSQVNLSIKYGNSIFSPYAYVCYGLILNGVVLDIQSAYQFGQLSLTLVEKLNALEVKTEILFVAGSSTLHGKVHARETLPLLLEGYQSGLENGHLEYGGYAAMQKCQHSYFIGQELTGLEREMAKTSKALTQLKQKNALSWNRVFQQAVLTLVTPSNNSCSLLGEIYNEEKLLSLLRVGNDRTGLHYFYVNKLILCYLFEEYPQALENATQAQQYLDGVTAFLVVPVFHFYDSLARLAVYSSVPNSEQARLLLKVTSNQEKMPNWVHNAPMNFQHKYDLVEAEKAGVLGQIIEAMDFYERAVKGAKDNGYIQEEALAYELAAKFYLSKSKELSARAYMQEARYCYQLWGATAKVKDLETRYQQLFAVTQPGIKDTKNHTTTTGSGSGSNLDIATVMKANQAISGEIVLDKLLSSLMKILIENAGSQKGYLILASQGKLLIEAEGSIDSERVSVLQSLPLENCHILSEAIVNYVARTKESVVLNDATREGQFINAPYIKENQPKSILCVPLINQGKLISIVYLENNLTTGAFTPERVEVLKLLSGQAAISIENAQLYREVRENESRLAQFLEAVPVGIGILDSDGKPYYINRVAQQLLGKGVVPNAKPTQIAEVYQAYIAGTDQVYPNDKLPIVRALRGESSTVNDMEIRQQNKIVPLEVWGTPIYDKKGNVTYAINAFQDITERKKAETERQRFTNQLFQLNKAYERFVPRQFLQFLEKSSIIDVELGDQVQLEMSVLFFDIRDFTALSEKMTPEDNFKFINSYLSRMEPAITENHGFIDKYIGDAIMALFSGEADNAVKAGITMLHRLAEYNQHRANSGFAPIQNGIGINTGSLMLGTVGGQNRMDGTVISDSVNLASRIESLTKEYGVSLLISQQTFSHLQNPTDYAIRQVDRVKVKGKSEVVTVYEVFDADRAEVKEKKLATLQTYTEACSYYNLNAYAEAAQRFEDCLRQNPSDRVAQIYLKRTQAKI
jgi:GAF domain-containing protein/class 3 adenylate cyclase